MKIRWKILSLLLILSLICLTSCKKDDLIEGKVKIVYELEGGKYKNSSSQIVHYYDFKPGSTNLIYDPNTLDIDEEVTKPGYVFDGWYLSKEEVDGNTVYKDKWDFDNDRATDEGMTLYAYWKKAIIYSYSLCYTDEDGSEKVLGTYEVNEGEKLNDYLKYANKRIGYTSIGFYDASDNPWDEDFTHPGGESNLDIKVYVKFIKGNFVIVKTASDLIKYKNRNIYLANDIDMEGKEFNFNNYKGILMGNDFTISNFTVNYDATRSGLREDYEESSKSSLYISLFGDLNGATIENVNFKDVTVDVKTKLTTTYKIYVAPLATSSTESSVKNVTFECIYKYTELPKDFNVEEHLIFITDRAYYTKDESSEFENVIITIVNE